MPGRIVTTHYRYKPPKKRKTVPLPGPAVVTTERKRALVPTDAKKLEPASTVARKAKPCNDNRPDTASQNKPAAIVRPAKPSRAMHKLPEDNPKPAIVTTTRPKRAPPMPRIFRWSCRCPVSRSSAPGAITTG